MANIASQYFQNAQYYPHHYAPMINVPTSIRLPSMGEIVTSVELVTKKIYDLSRKIDRIDSRVNDWVNLGLAERMVIVEKGIDAVKIRQNEFDEKIEHINTVNKYTIKDIDDIYHHIQDLDDQNEGTNKWLERVSDILSKHTKKLRHAKQRSRDLVTKYTETGILRRRISKVEEFNTEFAECFETPEHLRCIITQMSNQVEECDKMLSTIARYGYTGGECVGYNLPRADDVSENSIFIDEYITDHEGRCEGVEAWKNVEEYFACYGEDSNEESREQITQQEHKPASSFQCSPAMATCDGMYTGGRMEEDDNDDDEFEKV